MYTWVCASQPPTIPATDLVWSLSKLVSCCIQGVFALANSLHKTEADRRETVVENTPQRGIPQPVIFVFQRVHLHQDRFHHGLGRVPSPLGVSFSAAVTPGHQLGKTVSHFGTQRAVVLACDLQRVDGQGLLPKVSSDRLLRRSRGQVRPRVGYTTGPHMALRADERVCLLLLKQTVELLSGTVQSAGQSSGHAKPSRPLIFLGRPTGWPRHASSSTISAAGTVGGWRRRAVAPRSPRVAS